ncbi:MAG: cytidine deaminase [Planctomycetaceae bacterium]|nr:cytidine deaminase [Planctomycetaceae bacterium]
MTELKLPENWVMLREASRQARLHAYAPYSGYQVGAAVLTDTGRIFAGCNVENASYGLTICAERVAIGNAVAACGVMNSARSGKDAQENRPQITAICISLTGIAVPCGACRQVLHEFNPQMLVLLDNLQVSTDETGDAEDSPQVVALEELLPRAFSLDYS